MNYYEQLFIYLSYSYWLFFILSRFNFWNDAQYIFEQISFYYHLLIALVLAILFHPFTNKTVHLTPIRRRMIFVSAMSFIISTVSPKMFSIHI